MKDDEQRRRALDAVGREAKDGLVPAHVDWDRVQASLDARVAKTAQVRTPRPSRAPWIVAGIAAAAAAFALVPRRPLHDERRVASTAETMHVEPVAVAPPGERFEAHDVRARFVRDGTVTWVAEPGSRGNVHAAGAAVVVDLEAGAVEAQVTRSPLPESFAVDVREGGDVVRLAVHGTHLRVARHGRHVVVDLSEGVIAIGRPPREGLTKGTTVTAPAHVELDVHELATSLAVDARAEAVRPPASLDDGPAAPLATAPAPPRASESTHAAHAPSASRARPAPAAVTLDELARAVAACAAATEKPGAARVTAESQLHLSVDPSGHATSARFDPPLARPVQECAAREIYSVKIAATGDVNVPVSFTY